MPTPSLSPHLPLAGVWAECGCGCGCDWGVPEDVKLSCCDVEIGREAEGRENKGEMDRKRQKR